MEDASVEYEVQQILEQKCFKGKPYYLIKWKGFPKAQSTWQPIQNMENSLCYLIEWKKQKIRDNRKKIQKKIHKEYNTSNLHHSKQSSSDHEQEIFQFKEDQKIDPSRHRNKAKEIKNKHEKKRLIKSNNTNQQQEFNLIKYNQQHSIPPQHPTNHQTINKQIPIPIQSNLIQIYQNQQVDQSESSCFSVIEKINNLPKDIIKKVRRTVIIGDKKYFDVQLKDEKIAMISYQKMKKLFPNILCEYYEQLVVKQPNN